MNYFIHKPFLALQIFETLPNDGDFTAAVQIFNEVAKDDFNLEDCTILGSEESNSKYFYH